MKYLLIFLFSVPAFAQIIHTREIPLSPHTYAVKKIRVKSKYISAQERDLILNKQVPEIVKKWDSVDRDLFYKSIVHYDNARIREKYPQLTNQTIEDLRVQFKPR